MRFWCVKYGGVAIKQGVCVCNFCRLYELMNVEKPVFLEVKSWKLYKLCYLVSVHKVGEFKAEIKFRNLGIENTET